MSDKKPLGKRIKNGLIFRAVVFLMVVVKLLPRPASLLLARLLAATGYCLAANERRKIHANLQQAYGASLSAKARDEIGRRVFSNIAQNLVDAVLMPSLLRTRAESIMRITGLEHTRPFLENKKGIIFLTAHMGCFEMMPPRFALLGYPMIVLGAKLYDPRLNDIIVESRKTFNVSYVERGQGLKEIYKNLKEGGGFGVLCDLDTRVESRFIDFFGQPAKTPSGPFKLGIRRGVPLVPIFTVRAADGCQQVTVHPEIIPSGANEEEKISDAMRQYNFILEEMIRRDPGQWIWMHERWKSRP
ncbi:MAG: lysophospholipid acyltransferase family protein [Fibrobacterota bacterium]